MGMFSLSMLTKYFLWTVILGMQWNIGEFIQNQVGVHHCKYFLNTHLPLCCSEMCIKIVSLLRPLISTFKKLLWVVFKGTVHSIPCAKCQIFFLFTWNTHRFNVIYYIILQFRCCNLRHFSDIYFAWESFAMGTYLCCYSLDQLFLDCCNTQTKVCNVR